MKINKSKFILLILLCLQGVLTFGQNVAGNYIEMRDQLKVLKDDNTLYSTLAGSPYVENEFVQGKIIIKGQKAQPAYLKYNVAKDQIEIKANPLQKDVFVLPRNNQYSFELKNYTYYYGSVTTSKNGYLQGYLMKFYEGDDVGFIAKPVVRIERAKAAETSYDRAKPATMIVETEYYISVDGRPYEKIRLKERIIKRKLKDSEKMEAYFDKHKVNSEDDVVDLLQFYEESAM